MWKVSKKLLIAFVVATLAGACLHFAYDILPNPVTAALAPVNESLWEHVKILFWPYMVSAFLLTKGGEKGCKAPWFLSALMLSAAMLILGYFYHVVLCGDALAVDVGLYVLLMAAGYVLPGALQKLTASPFLRDMAVLAAAALAVMLILFSFLPPDGILFTDLSGANTWATIPYC